MYCQKCGKQTKPLDTFCTNCGSQLKLQQQDQNNGTSNVIIPQNNRSNTVNNNTSESAKKNRSLPLIIMSVAVVVIITVIIIIYISTFGNPIRPTVYKPVIYLYPTEETEVTVELCYRGLLEFTYPAYDNGWSVTAYPDGMLINHQDNREYSYLFWEGQGEADYDLSSGFVVRGEDSAVFLQEKLSYIGLLPHEYNEFIVYWLPQMQNNAYNLITFQGEAYTDTAELVISPAPDSILRVFMVFVLLDQPVEIEKQTLSRFSREGFSVIEWGGCMLRQ